MNNKIENNENETGQFPLNQLYFYLTEGCNLACTHCWLTPKLQTESHSYPTLPVPLFKKIVKEAKPLGLSGVKLTGGEPLMHPHITELLRFIKTQEISLAIETNGVLCTAQLAADIMACNNPFIAVSLDGADAETHDHIRGIKGAFNDALNGIKNLVKAGAKPQIIMSIMRHNNDQVEDVVRLAESLGARSVKFNLVQPTGRGEKMAVNRETLTIDELLRLGDWVETSLASTTSLNLYYHQPPAFRPLSKIFGKDGSGSMNCNILNILGVLPDGSYALCGIGTQVPELVFGHPGTVGLKDIWDNTPVLRELREGIPDRFKGICRDCVMKKSCLGSCIAQNYYKSKNLWAPFWFCVEAHEKGLFPGTRISPDPVTISKQN